MTDGIKKACCAFPIHVVMMVMGLGYVYFMSFNVCRVRLVCFSGSATLDDRFYSNSLSKCKHTYM